MLISPLNAELNPMCHFLALLGAHHILYVSRIRVKWFTQNLSLQSRHTFHVQQLSPENSVLYDVM